MHTAITTPHTPPSSLHSLLAERGESAESLAKDATTGQVRYDLMEAFEEVIRLLV